MTLATLTDAAVTAHAATTAHNRATTHALGWNWDQDQDQDHDDHDVLVLDEEAVLRSAPSWSEALEQLDSAYVDLTFTVETILLHDDETATPTQISKAARAVLCAILDQLDRPTRQVRQVRRVVAYCHANQLGEPGRQTLHHQAARLAAAAASHGWTITAWTYDLGGSADANDDASRALPGLHRALALLGAGTAEGLLAVEMPCQLAALADRHDWEFGSASRGGAWLPHRDPAPPAGPRHTHAHRLQRTAQQQRSRP